MALRGIVASLLFLFAATPAHAATVTKTLRAGPFRLDGFETLRPRLGVPAPRTDGYITHMDAWLVRRDGRRVPIRRVMMHHVVFLDRSVDPNRQRTTCEARTEQPFYGTGEEREKLVLPPGYGYRVRASDRWRMQTMLMSHGLTAQTVFVQYRMRIVTGHRLTPVRPFWLRANGCTTGPSYDVSGDQPPGSIHRKSFAWRMPLSGRIVAAGAHLHGSAKGMTISQPSCADRMLIEHLPRYGSPSDVVYRVRPVLHEPGPVSTGYFLSRTGISVRRGERLRVTGMYDASRPHPQVMAITHVYIAPGRATQRRCAPLPADARTIWTRRDGTLAPPVITVPLNGIDDQGHVVEIDRPPGPTVVRGLHATVALAGGRYQPANLSVAAGATVTWRWRDPIEHNLMLANGPRNLTGPIRARGFSKSRRLMAAGTYRLFCSLHPVTMQQVIVVRGAAPTGSAEPA